MNKGRRKFNAAFKAKVAIEALKEQLTLAELAEKYDIHPTQITELKKQLLSGSEDVFDQGKKAGSDASDHQEEKDELYKQIGQLKVEVDWLKKKSEQAFGKNWKDGFSK
ncbi:transposase [Chitinophaga sancti]|uniref:Transposase n=2 Tax=Chitinophaga sancti TaxID=1004 RepID=A0ABZ0XCX0_9BACT|nr:transposase [Chitinophaga sancti]WQD59613.1 transposase [Chitinophaga sancti]WQG88256.1 transposase [Chitinophaga sancti]